MTPFTEKKFLGKFWGIENIYEYEKIEQIK
jgi:hypothetical protein